MPIPVVCPSCGNNISAPDHVKGRTLRCFKCLSPFTVPNVAPIPAPVAPMAQLAPSYQPAAAPAPLEPALAPVAVPEPAPEAGPAPMLFEEAPPEISSPEPVFAEAPVSEPTSEPVPNADDMAAALFEEAPPASSDSPPPPDAGNPFELAPEPAGDAPVLSDELPSTQDVPLEEAPMELSSTDEISAPLEEAPVEEAVVEEAAEEPEQPRKSRKVAALLAFFLPFSIHRFYLGYTKSAVLQILLYCVGLGIVWQVFDGLRLLFGVGFKKDGRGVPLR